MVTRPVVYRRHSVPLLPVGFAEAADLLRVRGNLVFPLRDLDLVRIVIR
jgi:hypothetical protein